MNVSDESTHYDFITEQIEPLRAVVRVPSDINSPKSEVGDNEVVHVAFDADSARRFFDSASAICEGRLTNSDSDPMAEIEALGGGTIEDKEVLERIFDSCDIRIFTFIPSRFKLTSGGRCYHVDDYDEMDFLAGDIPD